MLLIGFSFPESSFSPALLNMCKLFKFSDALSRHEAICDKDMKQIGIDLCLRDFETYQLKASGETG
jgi:hypothetical protein